MLSEKECPLKKSKSGFRPFYPTTEIKQAEDELFYINISCTSSDICFLVHTYVQFILHNHVMLWYSRAFPTRSLVDVDWSRAGLVSYAELKQLRTGRVSLNMDSVFYILLTSHPRG